MHKFEIHLKSGHILTWQCKGKKRAKGIRKTLEDVLFNPERDSSSEPVFLGRKKGEKRVAFLEKDVVAFLYKDDKPYVISVNSGGRLDGINPDDIQKTLQLAKAKTEEETN